MGEVIVGEVPVEPLRPGRAGVDATALRLFGQHGVAATSLQMIADSLGVAKSAVYYHYRSKDDLVVGVLAPLLDELPGILEEARAHRSQAARVDALVSGLIHHVLQQSRRFAVLAGDPYVREALSSVEWLGRWWSGVLDLLAGPDPDPEVLVRVSMFIRCLAGPPTDPWLDDVDPDIVRTAMLDGARRLLQLPRRARPTVPHTMTAGIMAK